MRFFSSISLLQYPGKLPFSGSGLPSPENGVRFVSFSNANHELKEIRSGKASKDKGKRTVGGAHVRSLMNTILFLKPMEERYDRLTNRGNSGIHQVFTQLELDIADFSGSFSFFEFCGSNKRNSFRGKIRFPFFICVCLVGEKADVTDEIKVFFGGTLTTRYKSGEGYTIEIDEDLIKANVIKNCLEERIRIAGKCKDK
jgi:hypothetical protein